MEEEEEDEGEGQLRGEHSTHPWVPHGFLTFPLSAHLNQLLANLSLLTLNYCKLLVVTPLTSNLEKNNSLQREKNPIISQ